MDQFLKQLLQPVSSLVFSEDEVVQKKLQDILQRRYLVCLFDIVSISETNVLQHIISAGEFTEEARHYVSCIKDALAAENGLSFGMPIKAENMREYLKASLALSVDKLGIAPHAVSALKGIGIFFCRDLVQWSRRSLSEAGIGSDRIDDIVQALRNHQLLLGMRGLIAG